MSAPVRVASETAASFSARCESHLRAVVARGPTAELDASEVYAEGVVAGLSIAIAALQRRERIIDHTARWEAHLRRVRTRAGQ